MNPPSMPTPSSPVTRRTFLKTGAILTAGIASLSLGARAQTNQNSKLRVFQIGVGGIGALQRKGLAGHPMVEFVGFCDVEQREIDKISKDHPNAWTLHDYREAFANRVDQFDAVIVDTPDINHCPMMVTALKHRKHLYGQKPLVQQLAELKTIREALAARPDSITQMGNQRACKEGRMQAVEMLRSGQFGKAKEAYVWTGKMERGTYFVEPWSDYTPAQPVPGSLNWDLWRGPVVDDLPYSEDLAPRRWRSFWATGGGQLADWGCHLLDLLFFAYDLPSPESVQTDTIRRAGVGHSGDNTSTITFAGGGSKFAHEKFVVSYRDSAMQPCFASLGLPDMKVGPNHTMVVCEEGTLLLQADGKITVFRNGKVVENEPLPKVEPRDHWKDWADDCLGAKKPLWTPLTIGWRITEPALLAVKATRYPGKELRWDSATCRFTNHDEANKEILSRTYREGFAPPQMS
jgi:predicted dehydrogenase